jgi:hypothetical protein
MNRVSNIRTGDPKIDKAPNKLAIASGISKWSTVSGSEVNIKLHRSVDSAVISESSTRKEVLSVLLLREKDTIRCGGDLKTKKITKGTQIRHKEGLTKMLLHKGNKLRVVTRDDHVIDIEKKKCATMRRSVNKKSRIMIARLKASINENRGEALEPSARSLLKTIEGTTQPTNRPIRNGVPRRWLHIDFLTKLTIEEGVLDIQLRNRPLTNRGNSEKGPNSGHVSNRSKSLLVVNTILLLETTRHKASLIALKRAIRAGLDLVDPLASDRSDMKW